MFRKFWFNNTANCQVTSDHLPLPTVPGLIPVKPVAELLSPHAGHVTQIDELAGVSKEHFQCFYLHAIERFARFVQQLPASEVHHHAGPGGLLAHGLDVCIIALKRRRSYLLSETGGAEEISEKQDLWTYAVFLAALCHDLAKVAVDQRVIVYDSLHNAVPWEPWQYFIDEQGLWYTTEFVRHKQYRLHEKASPLLVHRIIPPLGMKWLAVDPHIFSQWLASISGDTENAALIGEIISLADGQSVATNLGADSNRMPSVKTIPLYEKMLTALRFLLSEGELPLNRNGAAGWIKNDACWLVSKRTVDAIREQLIQEGHSGIPTKNGRLFDVLQEHGILLPSGEKAIWTATIEGEGWRNELTLIKIPVSKIWPNSTTRPDEFDGSVVPLDSHKDIAPNEKHAEVTGQQPHEKQVPEQTANITIEQPIPEPQLLNESTSSPPESKAYDLLQFLPSSAEDTIETASEKSVQTEINPGNVFNENEEKNFQPESSTRIDTKEIEKPAKGNADSIAQFFAWIQSGVQQGQLKVNQPKARIHVVDEGVILVTPGIFQDFAKSQSNAANLKWTAIQQKVLKKNWHVRDENGLNVIKFQVNGKSKSTSVNAILFQDVSWIFGDQSASPCNPHLSRACSSSL
jgi:conjugal transfer pilus assembly protein TraI